MYGGYARHTDAVQAIVREITSLNAAINAPGLPGADAQVIWARMVLLIMDGWYVNIATRGVQAQHTWYNTAWLQTTPVAMATMT